MNQRFMVGGVEPLGDHEIGVIAASSDLARDGHVLVVRGLSLENYRKNPIVLWNHNPDEPIGAAKAVSVVGDDLAARIELSQASPTAQKALAFAKSGVVKGVSIGFDVIDAEPLDPSRGTRGGMRITASELFEISLVAIPADVKATVVARSHKSHPDATAILRSLPANSAAAVARALDQVGRQRDGARPLMSLSDSERAMLYQRERSAHALAVWAYQEGEQERHSSYAQRQADLSRLSPKH